jgi:hypothetical protein
MSKHPRRQRQAEMQGKPSRHGEDGDTEDGRSEENHDEHGDHSNRAGRHGRRGGGHDGDGDGGHGGDGGDGDGKREPSGERQIFVDMVQRRMGGGAPPSGNAYARAMQQWQKLPGAVGFVAVPNVPETGDGGSAPDGGSGGSPPQGGGKDEGGGR